MPHLIWSARAFSDLRRLQAFLRPKNPRAAKRAVNEIRQSAEQLIQFPAIGRPVHGLEEAYRDLIIPFGASGYILRYRLDGDDVVVVAIRHAREAGFDLT